MDRKLLDNVEHWRDWAGEARAVADTIDDPEARAIMERVAEGYEQFARRAEERRAIRQNSD